MKKSTIEVVLPASFVEQCSAKGINLPFAMGVSYNDARVAFKVVVVPDDYFSDFYA